MTADEAEWMRAWERVGDGMAELLVPSLRRVLRRKAEQAVREFRAKRPVPPVRPRWTSPAVDPVADMNRAILDHWLADAILRSWK